MAARGNRAARFHSHAYADSSALPASAGVRKGWRGEFGALRLWCGCLERWGEPATSALTRPLAHPPACPPACLPAHPPARPPDPSPSFCPRSAVQRLVPPFPPPSPHRLTDRAAIAARCARRPGIAHRTRPRGAPCPLPPPPPRRRQPGHRLQTARRDSAAGLAGLGPPAGRGRTGYTLLVRLY